MKRRELLAGASALAIVASLPAMATVIITPLGDDTLSIKTGGSLLIEQVISFAIDQKFSAFSVQQVLGFEWLQFITRNDLVAASRERLVQDPYYRERLNGLLAIKAGLEKMFPNNIDAQIDWCGLTQFCSVLSVREQMMGSDRDVAFAATMIERRVG